MGQYIILALFITSILLLAYFLMGKRKVKGVLHGKSTLPANILSLLNSEVHFYKNLPAEKKTQFEAEMLQFLSQNDITGLDVEIDDLTITLVGASAIIPIFNFPDWEYPNLGDILIFPEAIDSFQTYDKSANFSTLGQVSESSFRTDVMKLSQRDLINGFRSSNKHNVGVHEFTHLVDKADGDIDGIPETLIPKELVKVWSDRIHYEISKIKNTTTNDIDPYGATNEAEFFAVVTEYFFKQPEELKKHHPELYKLLCVIFERTR